MDVAIVHEVRLRQVMTLDEDGLAAVAEAFAKLAQGQVQMPPVMHIPVPEHEGEVDVKAAHIQGWDHLVLKQSSGFFHNPERGLPSASGLMVVIDAHTGIPAALLLDNGYLTDLRTGLAGALAAQYLAPQPCRRVGVLGAGVQARFQVQALQLVRDFAELWVYARRPEEGARYAAEMEPVCACPVHVATEISSLVQAVDCLITTTPARQALVRAEDLHPGLHITAMGSDAPGKQELAPEVLLCADQLVCDRREQVALLGELQHLSSEQRQSLVLQELGQLVLGQRLGRQRPEEITVCDLTGTGAQDTAIANLALRRLRA